MKTFVFRAACAIAYVLYAMGCSNPVNDGHRKPSERVYWLQADSVQVATFNHEDFGDYIAGVTLMRVTNLLDAANGALLDVYNLVNSILHEVTPAIEYCSRIGRQPDNCSILVGTEHCQEDCSEDHVRGLKLGGSVWVQQYHLIPRSEYVRPGGIGAWYLDAIEARSWQDHPGGWQYGLFRLPIPKIKLTEWEEHGWDGVPVSDLPDFSTLTPYRLQG